MLMLSEIVRELSLNLRTEDVDREVHGGYCSDLLSDVLKNAKGADIWVTNHKHQNCVAVASLLDLSAIVIAGGVEPDEETLSKAKSEQVPLCTTEMSAFDVVGKLYELGVRGPLLP